MRLCVQCENVICCFLFLSSNPTSRNLRMLDARTNFVVECASTIYFVLFFAHVHCVCVPVCCICICIYCFVVFALCVVIAAEKSLCILRVGFVHWISYITPPPAPTNKNKPPTINPKTNKHANNFISRVH